MCSGASGKVFRRHTDKTIISKLTIPTWRNNAQKGKYG